MLSLRFIDSDELCCVLCAVLRADATVDLPSSLAFKSHKPKPHIPADYKLERPITKPLGPDQENPIVFYDVWCVRVFVCVCVCCSAASACCYGACAIGTLLTLSATLSCLLKKPVAPLPSFCAVAHIEQQQQSPKTPTRAHMLTPPSVMCSAVCLQGGAGPCGAEVLVDVSVCT